VVGLSRIYLIDETAFMQKLEVGVCNLIAEEYFYSPFIEDIVEKMKSDF